MKRFFLIDAMALAYRSHFAFGRPLTTSDGLPTSAIYGCAMFVNKLLGEEKPEYFGFVSDTPEPTFRHKMFPEYKGTRDAMPDDLSKQLPHIFRLFEAYGVPLVRMPGYEADDIIGTLVSKYGAGDTSCYIVSGDKDFYQLVNDNVFVYSPKKNEPAVIVDSKGVAEKFQCRPDQMIECLAIMGDKVDNVPGVHGIGEKGAASLIAKYGTLEGIYEHIDEIKAKRQKEGLLNHRDDAFLSRDLVTIARDVPIDLELGNFACDPGRAQANPEILALYEEFEFRQLAERAGQSLGTAVVPARARIEIVHEDREYDASAELDEFLGQRSHKDISVSYVANQDRIADANVSRIALCNGGRVAGFDFDKSSWEKVCDSLERSSGALLGHDLKSLGIALLNSDSRLPGKIFDTEVGHYLLDSNQTKHDLDKMAPQQIGALRPFDEDEMQLGDEDEEQLFRDADLIFDLGDILARKLDQDAQTRVMNECEMPLLPVLAKMEHRGVFLDADPLMELSGELGEAAVKLEKEIWDVAGEEFNVASTKQLQEILFKKLKVHEELGVTRIKKTKTGYSTDESVLKQLSGHPLPAKILEYRMVSKLKNTYVDTLPQHINPKTHRLHTTFHQSVAATGRLSSDGPNLQNIPMRTALGRKVRAAFRPASADDVILSADYSQVEIRLMAHLAKADDLIDAFKRGLDIHRVTAAKVFNTTEDAVTSEQRSQAKAVNFGIIYGMGPQRLAQETKVSVSAAKEFIDRYFQVYPGIKKFTENLIREARRTGYSETVLGRRRPIVGISDSNRAMQARAENIAVNAPIQGSAADIIKLAMINLDRRLSAEAPDVRILLQIHDELVFSCPRAQVDSASAIIRHEMSQAYETSVPLDVEIGWGNSWLEAH